MLRPTRGVACLLCTVGALIVLLLVLPPPAPSPAPSKHIALGLFAAEVGGASRDGGVVAQLLQGLAAFRDPRAWCTSNPYITEWGTSNFSAAAESLVTARGRLSAVSHVQKWRAKTWDRFETAPASQECEPKARYPPGRSKNPNQPGTDGGKFLCNLLALRDGCVIYSLGSNANFDFELEMIFNTPCEIYTFDCTKDPLPDLHPRIHYHKICLGEDSPLPELASYKSLSTIAAELGHTHVDLLKMDIEGYEYAVVESLFRGSMGGTEPKRALLPLPLQMSFELHYRTAMELPWSDGGAWPHNEPQSLSTGDMSILWTQLADLGYVVVSREDNRDCQHCSEFTLVRAFC